jgi:uncharacterized protein (DUF2267 family)
MSSTGLSSIDKTVNLTNQWLNELMELLSWHDKQKTYHALGAVLHALRDRLTLAEVAALGSQLPLLVRGIYYDGWQPIHKPVRDRKRAAFLAHITAAFPDDQQLDAENVVWSVFQVLSKHISPGLVQNVQAVLPLELRGLWT